MERIVRWWANNPIAANLLMVSVILAGLLSIRLAEREFFPNVPINYVNISAVWLGASPADMDEIIVKRINEALRDVDDIITEISSTASQGSARVFVEVDTSVDMATALQRIEQNVLAIPSFPTDMEPLTITQIRNENEEFRAALYGDVSESVLYQTAMRLRAELAEQPGVPKVELFGAREPEIAIEVNQESLQRYGISVQQVVQAIAGSSVELAGGRIKASGGTISVAARNLARTGFHVGDIEIRRTKEHGAVYVRDVATVTDGFEDINFVARVHGKPAILLQVMSSPNMDVIKMSDSANKWLEEVKPSLPQGMNIVPWFDTADILRGRIETISNAALGGLILVLLVLVLSLRLSVAFWTACGIAIAYAGAFAVMTPNDVSINIISLFAFLLVLGIVVDDAIIVGESIHRQFEAGDRGENAAVRGAVRVSRPVIFAVLTSMLTFVPWLLLTGAQVQITRHIAIVAIGALLFSMIEVFCILPSHLRKMRELNMKSRFVRLQTRIADGIVRIARGPFRKLSIWSIRNRYTVLAGFIAIFMLCNAVISNKLVASRFSVEVENEVIAISFETYPGTPFDRTQEMAAQLEAAMTSLREQSESLWGIQVASEYYSRTNDESVLGLLRLLPPEERNDVSAKVIGEKWRELVGDVYGVKRVTVNTNINNSGPDLEYELVGEDRQRLYAAVDALSEHLRTYSDVRDVYDTASYGERELKVSLKERGTQLGLDLGDVIRAVRTAYYGSEVQRVQRGDHEVRIMVRYDKRTRTSLHSLRTLRIYTQGGAYVPLGEVANVEFGAGAGEVTRRNRQQVVEVGAYADDTTKDAIDKQVREGFLKEIGNEFPGVRERVSGANESLAEFLGELTSLYTIVLLLQYALLAIAFGSYFLPLVVMVAIPFGYAGAVIGHMLWGLPISLFSYLGIGAAAGVVVNDNLVLVDQALRNRAQGVGHGAAVVRAVATRFRAVMLTTVTTVIGLVPLLLEDSTQAQFLKPAVVSLVFAVGFASTVTMFLVPALFVIGSDATLAMRRLRAYISLMNRRAFDNLRTKIDNRKT